MAFFSLWPSLVFRSSAYKSSSRRNRLSIAPTAQLSLIGIGIQSTTFRHHTLLLLLQYLLRPPTIHVHPLVCTISCHFICCAIFYFTFRIIIFLLSHANLSIILSSMLIYPPYTWHALSPVNSIGRRLPISRKPSLGFETLRSSSQHCHHEPPSSRTSPIPPTVFVS